MDQLDFLENSDAATRQRDHESVAKLTVLLVVFALSSVFIPA
jgi:hypothetical protein